MRRLLIIFMLFALPLQVSWAAVAIYCKHESGVAAKHFGHHEHEHEGHAKKAEPAKDPSSLTVDNDCAVCHLSSVGAITIESASLLPFLSPSERTSAPGELPSFIHPDRPERPNWVRAA